MSLIKCVDCGKEISSEAESCPNCGKPSPIIKHKKVASISRLISFSLLVLLFLGLIWFLIWSYLPKQLLVGRWQKKQDIIELFPDSVINIKNGNTSISGTYKIQNSNTAKVNLDGIGALFSPVIINYKVTAGELIISYNNRTETYKRITNPPIVVNITNIISKEIFNYINK